MAPYIKMTIGKETTNIDPLAYSERAIMTTTIATQYRYWVAYLLNAQLCDAYLTAGSL